MVRSLARATRTAHAPSRSEGSAGSVAARLRGVRLFVARYRRPLAAAAAALAVGAGLLAARPPSPPTVPVLVAAHDLDTGAVPGPGDLRTARFAPADVPARALRHRSDTQGRALAAAVRRGEPITDVRLVGPQLRGLPGGVALPVRFADADAARLLRPGDRVDVLAGPVPDGASSLLGPTARPGTAVARVVARDAVVLARPEGSPDRGGGLLILSVPAESATALAGAAVGAPLTYTIRGTPGGVVATDGN
ncbi:hypothetical protein [Yinghuangia seranimata]|uniref:hypothetical protein n=1 Tax=Yinghuangia seranimata TaxID=408067 RepID=UPI00248B9DFF|nr:hypothetical protein [Yinghuangia seranimata]MDI2128764.1 hypothetical protein [Yinghuangia seranimata]